MIVGAAVVPTAPVLVPGVAGALPPELAALAAATGVALRGMPPADVAVLIAVAPPDGGHGCYDSAVASFAGVGLPELVLEAPVDRVAVEAVTRDAQYPLYQGEALPLGLAALVHQLAAAGRRCAVVPVAVPAEAGADVLVGVGAGIASALDGPGSRAVVVAAGDLAAGLSPSAPLALVDGAREWEDRVVDVVDKGRLDGLARLGPEEARRMGALGWAPLVVLHGACARAKIGLAVRRHGAPRGVGYLVAAG